MTTSTPVTPALERRHRRYASDLTNKEWRIIRPFLVRSSGPGHPQVLDLRLIVNSIFYPRLLCFESASRRSARLSPTANRPCSFTNKTTASRLTTVITAQQVWAAGHDAVLNATRSFKTYDAC